MTCPFYPFSSSAETLRFEFVSTGQRIIHKVIVYQQLPSTDAYNLALGDVDEQGKVDYDVTSDNGDRDQILATVVQTMIAFFGQHPGTFVVIAGSTPSRTRLYQVVIARELAEIQKRFNVTGITDASNEPFSKGRSYRAFVISMK